MQNLLLNNFQLKYQRRRKRKKLFKFLLIIFIAALSFYLIFSRFAQGKQNPLINPSAKTPQKQSLESVITNTLTDAKGTYAVVVKNLKTGESSFPKENSPTVYYQNKDTFFEGGSLYKLWVMATVFKQIQQGKLTEDQLLSNDIATLNTKFSIDPEQAEQTDGTISLTVHDALNQMITISHNYAALLLTEKVKLSSVAAYLKENGFNNSAVGTNGEPPVSTASDIALFLEKLYKGELANEQYTQAMLDLLKKQQLNDGLPKYLPDGSIIAHKTGDIGWFKHDAGIIYTDKGDYIIVVMSKSDLPAGAQERIAQISKAVFEYFTKESQTFPK